MPFTNTDVNAWYQRVLFRDGSYVKVYAYTNALNRNILSVEQVKNLILEETASSDVDPIVRLYQAAFNRCPDQAGEMYWVQNSRQNNLTLNDIASSFANSKEFVDHYGVNASSPINAATLTAFYNNVLQRSPDTAGFSFWLNSGLSVGQVLQYFSESTEFKGQVKSALGNFHYDQINNTLPANLGALWNVPKVAPHEPTPETPAPTATTFDVLNHFGSLSYIGSAVGDISFNVDSSGIATFTRQGINAATTLSVSAFNYSPNTIHLGANISDLSTANATALEGIIGFDANGHTYTVLDTIASANSLNFTTNYPNNVGINLSGSAGSQSVTGSTSNDTIYGGADDDTIDGGTGADSMDGGGGNDTYIIGLDGQAGSAVVNILFSDVNSSNTINNGDTFVINSGVVETAAWTTGDLLDLNLNPLGIFANLSGYAGFGDAAAGDLYYIRGGLSGSTFTVNSSGLDQLLTWTNSSGGGQKYVVLTGINADLTQSDII